MPQELELKFALRPRCLKQIADLLWLKQFQRTLPGKHKLYSIYFDTPDQTLKASGCSLRIRRDGKQWLQTIKSGGQITAGLHQHDEWETPLKHAHPDLTNIPDPAIRKLFENPDLRATLQPVFVTRFTRQIQLLQPVKDCTIELCLDHGKIIAHQRTEAISEIELELKSGDPLKLLDFAKELLEKSPCTLRLESTSKAERGYRLYSDYLPSPCKAVKISLKPGVPIHSALKTIMQQCLAQLTRNERGFLTISSDIEYLHQMRVALRRLRAAFQVFQQIFPGAALLPFIRKELKWLTRQLNPARDWDVMVTETLPQVNASLPQSALHLIEQQCQFYRKTHQKHARASVNSPRYTRLLIALCSWLYQIDAPDALFKSDQPRPDVMRKSTRSTVASLIAASHQKIIEHGKSIATLDTASLHALRIHIKELRYLIEFFHSLFPKNACKQQIVALSKLQNVLGSINDCCVTQYLLDEMQIKKQSKKQSTVIDTIHEWTLQRIQTQRTALIAAWQDFCDADSKSKPFWEKKV